MYSSKFAELSVYVRLNICYLYIIEYFKQGNIVIKWNCATGDTVKQINELIHQTTSIHYNREKLVNISYYTSLNRNSRVTNVLNLLHSGSFYSNNYKPSITHYGITNTRDIPASNESRNVGDLFLQLLSAVLNHLIYHLNSNVTHTSSKMFL